MSKSFLAVITLSVLTSSCIPKVPFVQNKDDIAEIAVKENVIAPDGRDPLANDTFSFPSPRSSELTKKITLWATYYYLPLLKDGTGTYPLRDMNSMELGPRVTLREWCDSAMEGSVRVSFNDGSAKTFNYAGVTDSEKVDCSSIFRIDVSKTKFREANGPYGDGIQDYILAPYRTLATDLTQIAPGTVLYVPEARGAKIVLANGRVIIHDGYFFAADKGGAIKGNHVDVYIGTSKSAAFFPWIKSSAEKTFSAFIIDNDSIISELSSLHLIK